MKKYLILFIPLFHLLITINTFGTTYYVKPTGNNTFDGTNWSEAWATIGHAATNVSQPGDVVIVSNGTYAGQVNITNSGSSGNPITFISYNTNAAIIDGDTYCFFLDSAKHIRIYGFTCKLASDTGIMLDGTAISNQIINNTIYSNTITGIEVDWETVLDSAHHNLIQSNHIFEHIGTGVMIDYSSYNVIRDNYIHDHDNQGIYVSGAGGGQTRSNMIINNRVYANGSYGIRESGAPAHQTVYLSNIIYGPGQNRGINISSSDGCVIKDNRISRNQYGITIQSSDINNTLIINNTICSNSWCGIQMNPSDGINNVVISNDIFGPSQGRGIIIQNGVNSVVAKRNNIFKNTYGFELTSQPRYSSIIGNLIYSNSTYGIYMHSNDADNTSIMSNRIYGGNQDIGIYNSNGDDTKIYRNLITRNRGYGILIRSDADNNEIINNTIFGNQTNDGIYWADTANGDVVNNIIMSNGDSGSDYGIASDSSNNITVSFNNIYGNFAGSVNGSITVEGGNVSGNPLIDINTFEITSASSPAVDRGTVVSGYPTGHSGETMDMGWKESPYTNIRTINTYYVKPTGNNINSGLSWSQAWQTIGNSAGTLIAGDVVIVSNGIYNEKVIPQNSGNAGNPITYRAYNKNAVFIDGSDYGFHISSKNHIRIDGFVICKNSSDGIRIDGNSVSNVIINNVIYSNTAYGVYLNSDNADYNIFQSNLIFGPDQSYGISINNSDNNIISDNNKIHNHSDRGVYITGSAVSNTFINNEIYSNDNYGVYINSDTADNNLILTNNIWGANQYYGIRNDDGDNNIIRLNRIHNNEEHGIYLYGSAVSNYIIKNMIYSNDNYGAYIISDLTDNNFILSNTIFGGGQDFGIRIREGDNNKICRNLIKNNNQFGIYIETSATNIEIINNTIYGSGINHGVFWNNSSGKLLNNIIMSNGGYGIEVNSATPVYIAYNDFYGNSNGPTNNPGGGMAWGASNIFQNPLIDTSSTFKIMDKNSPAVDSGTNVPGITDAFSGNGPDMGWNEFLYSNTSSAELTDTSKNIIIAKEGRCIKLSKFAIGTEIQLQNIMGKPLGKVVMNDPSDPYICPPDDIHPGVYIFVIDDKKGNVVYRKYFLPLGD